MGKAKRIDVDAIQAQLDSLLRKRETLKTLLELEKEKRGLGKDEVVFVGMANISEYYWCAMKSLYASRQDEIRFFEVYLRDRISYSLGLGLINKLPDSHWGLLQVGDDLSFSDIEDILDKKAESGGVEIEEMGMEWVDENGQRVMIINPGLPQEKIELLEQQAKVKGVRIVDPETAPKIRGELLGTTKAEQYPTIRWNFRWHKYVVVGVPDGITTEFVYEFKSTRNRFLMNFVKPVAFTQADLYGYFFRRSKKRVQIYLLEEGVTETWDTDVDRNRAEDVLTKFKKMEKGSLPLPPKAWKCKSCEFAKICIIRMR